MWSGLLFLLLGLIQVNNGQQTRSRGCSSRSGKPCLFPFFHNGTLYDGEQSKEKKRNGNCKECRRQSQVSSGLDVCAKTAFCHTSGAAAAAALALCMTERFNLMAEGKGKGERRAWCWYSNNVFMVPWLHCWKSVTLIRGDFVGSCPYFSSHTSFLMG